VIEDYSVLSSADCKIFVDVFAFEVVVKHFKNIAHFDTESEGTTAL